MQAAQASSSLAYQTTRTDALAELLGDVKAQLQGAKKTTSKLHDASPEAGLCHHSPKEDNVAERPSTLSADLRLGDDYGARSLEQQKEILLSFVEKEESRQETECMDSEADGSRVIAKFIDPTEGGVLTCNGVELTIPPGALTCGECIRMRVENQLSSDNPQAFIALEPHNIEFLRPVSVSISAHGCARTLEPGASSTCLAFVSRTNPLDPFCWESLSGDDSYNFSVDKKTETMNWQTNHFCFWFLAIIPVVALGALALYGGTIYWTDKMSTATRMAKREQHTTAEPSTMHSNAATQQDPAGSYSQASPIEVVQLFGQQAHQYEIQNCLATQEEFNFQAYYRRDPKSGQPDWISVLFSTMPIPGNAPPHHPVKYDGRDCLKAEWLWTYDPCRTCSVRKHSDVSIVFVMQPEEGFDLRQIKRDGTPDGPTQPKQIFWISTQDARTIKFKSFDFIISSQQHSLDLHPDLNAIRSISLYVYEDDGSKILQKHEGQERQRYVSYLERKSPEDHQIIKLFSEQGAQSPPSQDVMLPEVLKPDEKEIHIGDLPRRIWSQVVSYASNTENRLRNLAIELGLPQVEISAVVEDSSLSTNREKANAILANWSSNPCATFSRLVQALATLVGIGFCVQLARIYRAWKHYYQI